MIKPKIKLTLDVPYDAFENIIVTALEGGSNYWYWLGDISPLRAYFKKNNFEHDAISILIARALFNDPDFKLPVYDIENKTVLLGNVTKASLVSALENNPKEAMLFINEDDYDASTADVLFQSATMGEVIFG